LKSPRPRIASGFVCILIFNTSSGNSTTSPIPVKLGIPHLSFRDVSKGDGDFSPSRCGVHDQTPRLLPKRGSEPVTAVIVDHVSEVWLSAELVYPLRNFVSGGVSKTREEGDEF